MLEFSERDRRTTATVCERARAAGRLLICSVRQATIGVGPSPSLECDRAGNLDQLPLADESCESAGRPRRAERARVQFRKRRAGCGFFVRQRRRQFLFLLSKYRADLVSESGLPELGRR